MCIDHGHRKYPLVDVVRPAHGSYLLLESLSCEKSAARVVHLLIPSAGKEAFKLGRGHESEVRISDISVSRFHASIVCRPDGYFVEDNNSKFGTLALLNQIQLGPSRTLGVQVGRTTVSFAVQPVDHDL